MSVLVHPGAEDNAHICAESGSVAAGARHNAHICAESGSVAAGARAITLESVQVG